MCWSVHTPTENSQTRASGGLYLPQGPNKSLHTPMIVCKEHLCFLQGFLVTHFPKKESTLLRKQRACVGFSVSSFAQSTTSVTSLKKKNSSVLSLTYLMKWLLT